MSSDEETDCNESIAGSADRDYELFAACYVPCSVVVKRLTDEEIAHYLSIVDDRCKPQRAQKRIAKNFLRDVPRVDFGLFAQYKRSREAFFKKKQNAGRNPSAEIGDFGFDSGDEVAENSDADYVPEESNKNVSSGKKRKKMAYEEDYEWNPDGRTALSPKPPKKMRNLRVNTRRKRIESNSSSSCDGYNNESSGDPFDKATPDEPIKSGSFLWGTDQKQAPPPTRETGGFSAALLDGELLDQIVQEMQDYNRKEAKGRTRKPKQKGSRMLKITDELTPTIFEVQQVVRNMVNTVCTCERELAVKDPFKVACRWCSSMFTQESKSDDLCKICKDIMPKAKKQQKGKARGSAKSRIKEKVLKNLPKFEQQRLAFGEKGYSHMKGFASPSDSQDRFLTTVADVHSEPWTSDSEPKPGKKKKLGVSKKKKNSEVKAKAKTRVKKTPVLEKTGKKGLLRIDFPNAEKASGPQLNSVVTKQPTTNSVQYGTYLLPPVPTVVVANYAATDGKNGDYYLSSVYYQNEMTQHKTTPSKNDPALPSMPCINITASKALPSMPSMDQLSSFPNISISPMTFPQSSYASTVPQTQPSLQANQVQLIPSYSMEQELAAILNNPNLHLQPVEPRATSVATETDLASLFSNPHLQIQSLGLPDLPDDLLEEFSNDAPEHDEMESSDLNSKEASIHTSPVLGDAAKTTSSSESVQKENKPPQSDESSEEDMSSEALFRKMGAELDAICILGVVDLDRNPKWSLERIIETTNAKCEQLRSMTPTNEEQLKKVEENKETLHLAKSLLNRFGSFSKLSSSCLLTARIMQIKKEKVEEKESTRSSCQFATQSASIPEFIQVGGTGHIPSIETQISNISQIVPMTDNTFASCESRQTPSRGSGPLTPARPESAMSQVAEDTLTPAQIKKERLEAESQQTALPPPANPMQTFNPTVSVSNQGQTFNTNVSVSNQVPTFNTNVSVSNQGQTFHSSVSVPNQLQTFSASVSVSNRMPAPNQSTFILAQRNSPLVHYRASGGPPNVTVPNHQNVSKVLMNFTARQPSAPQNVVNNNNVLFKNQLVNVQQVYLPSPQQRFNVQQQNPPMNQFNIVQQGQPQNQQLLVNNQQQVLVRQHQNQVLVNSGPQQNQVLVNSGPQQNQVLTRHQNQVLVNSGQQQNQVLVRHLQSDQNQVMVNSGQQQNQVLVGRLQSDQNQVMVSGPPQLVNNAQYYQGGQVQQRIASVNPSLQAMQQIQPGSAGQIMSGGSYIMQNKQSPSLTEQMFCALCSKPATLRCKQCAKIAYCDTKCAKTYWHTRHKSECKPM